MLSKRAKFYLFHKNCNKAYNELLREIKYLEQVKGIDRFSKHPLLKEASDRYTARIYKLFLRYETK